ncbi:SRPBCC family protein [Micromonospora sp. NPDC052213]|uniref:SRPBCC family protein n=1 Tax=Micromonospora sp. NPDC052213 TaxID=3155812 RepID=UPI00341BDF54
MPLIDITTVVRAPTEHVFDLSLDVDAHTASMSSAGEQAVAGIRSGRMALDDTVTWAARHFGIRWRMTSRISAYDRPHRFVDEQVTGPFRRWHHEHTFTWDDASEATVMRDVIDFAAPFGVLGWLVTKILLLRYMRRLIQDRNAYLVSTLSHQADLP